jgi:hypothetical protein
MAVEYKNRHPFNNYRYSTHLSPALSTIREENHHRGKARQ